MPIITFLQDIFSAAKGPYHRKVGRYTQRFCSRAAKGSTNEMQKKIFLIAAICADELIAGLLGLDNKRQVTPFKGRTLKQKLTKQQVTAALRIYLSAILILISSQKKLVLQKTGLQEQELLKTWCSIFEYSPFDIQLFNGVLLQSYQQGGIDGLDIRVGKNIIEQLFVGNEALSTLERSTLQKIMLEDAAAVVRVLHTGKQEAV